MILDKLVQLVYQAGPSFYEDVLRVISFLIMAGLGIYGLRDSEDALDDLMPLLWIAAGFTVLLPVMSHYQNAILTDLYLYFR